ncbi:hypothetical protein BCR42DRAFT_450255 [Absidia repens]|uniref:Arylesterase-domain-containing protein n=1 Tax=Absidia repens TaxID=90262 RepID=A0A1X2IJF1_9FUNG|nr:hypothetical protein BCR42DRAFT_450255 [Absidia repens]
MFFTGNRLWVVVGAISIVAYPLYYLIGLASINKVVPSIGKDTCAKIVSPEGLSFCEDIVLGNGVAYASCDPAREKRNKVLDYNYFSEGETIPSGNIWRIDYTSTPPKSKPISTYSKPSDFHPLGLAIDEERKLILAINLPFDSEKALIEVFSIEDDGNLLHKRTIQHENLYTPNAVHIVDDHKWEASDGTPSFYFSNDHYYQKKLLKMLENTAILPISNVMFYDARSNNAYPVIGGLSFANGISGNDSTLFVSECNKRRVHQYNITLRPHEKDETKAVHVDYLQTVDVDMAVDNLEYDRVSGILVMAGHPKGLDFIRYAFARDRSLQSVPKAGSLVMEWNSSSQSAPKVVFSDDGHYYAASSTGALDSQNGKLLVSSLYDHGILVCDV